MSRDIAEAFALLGVEPVRDVQPRRIDGISLMPLDKVGCSRIDVTLRIRGLFRDTFPHLIDLFDQAVSLVIEQDGP